MKFRLVERFEEENNEIIKLIKSNFQVTKDPAIGGYYILPSGEAIKVNRDHADIDKFLIKQNIIPKHEVSFSDGSKYMDDLNCIRIRARGGKDSWINPYITLPKNRPTEKQFETLNSQIRELRQKFKAGELTQSEYQKMREPLEEQKDEIRLDYDTIKYKIIDEIAPINKDTRGIIGDYLDKLWESCDMELLFAWKIFVPDNDDFYTKEQEKFEAELKRGHYDFEKIFGKTDKTKCLYFLPNITKDDLENFWDQFSNVYGYRAYQKKLTDEEKQNELDVFLESKNLKKEFPLSLLTLSENFRKRYSHKSPEQIMSEAKVYIRNASKHTGKERWYYRGRMYHHPQAWELEQGIRNKYWEQWKKEN